MISIKFAQANQVLTKPDGWDEEKQGECGDLHVYNSGSYIASCWRPTAEELEALNAGGAVVVSLYGQTQPPMQLFTAVTETVEVQTDENDLVINDKEQAIEEFEDDLSSKGKTIN